MAEEKKKILIIFPPLWDINLAPMLSPPLLVGMLKDEGFNAEFFDMNSAFMNFILDKSFFEYAKNKVNFYIQELSSNRSSDLPSKMVMDYYKRIVDFFYNNKKLIYDFYSKNPNVQETIQKMKNEPNWNISRYYQFLRDFLQNLFMLNNNNNIPREFTLLYDWEHKIFKKIQEFSPDIIGFSIYCESQYKWSNDVTKELRKFSSGKFVYGGTEITSIKKQFDKEFFKNYADICIYGEGEMPLKLLAKEKPLSSIPNIIYLENNEVKTNKEVKYERFEFYRPSYEGVHFKDYFVTKTVLPIESSRGCYWHKCSFCNFMDCISYKAKKIDELIEEIKEYIKMYNVHHYFFTDAAIHPNYAEEFSRKILENDLKIYYLTDLRLEKEFDYDLLKLMYDAGLRVALWGLESGSDKILKSCNKGTTVENNSKVITTASKIGIYNWCWVIMKFPGETVEDLNLTRNFLIEHKNYIDYISMHDFTLLSNSLIAKEPEKYGLDKSLFDFKTSAVMYKCPEIINVVAEKYKKELNELYSAKIRSNPEDLSLMLLSQSQKRP